jgi:DNA polymerase-3 subunit epsilon
MTRIQIMQVNKQQIIFDAMLPTHNQLTTFAKVAKELYQHLQDKLILCMGANLKYAFLKQSYKALGFKLKMSFVDITQLAEKLYQKKYPSLTDLRACLNIKVSTFPNNIQFTKIIFEKLNLDFSINEIEAKLIKATSESSYDQQLKQAIDDLPNSMGVYIFHNNDGVPIYIGKSIHIKKRVESHFSARYRDSKELKLFHKTSHISHIKTSGELGALLLESQLIKQHRPIYNQRLRRLKHFYSFVLSTTASGYHFLEASSEKIGYGIFRSQHQAKAYLNNLADTHNLCHIMLGLEKKNAPCFSYQLKKCKGACIDKESVSEHNERLLKALSDKNLLDWPYEGAIAIFENDISSDYHYHVFNQWIYYGSTTTLKEAKHCQKQRAKVLDDVDAIKYIKTFLNEPTHQHCVHTLY